MVGQLWQESDGRYHDMTPEEIRRRDAANRDRRENSCPDCKKYRPNENGHMEYCKRE